MAKMQRLAAGFVVVGVVLLLTAGSGGFARLGASRAAQIATGTAEFLSASGVAYACETTPGCKVLASRGSVVRAGGEARTGRPGSAELQNRTTLFQLEQNATLQFQDVTNAFQRLLLKTGRLFAAHDPQGRDVVSVKARTTRVEASDTLFAVEVTEDERVIIEIPEGWGTATVALDNGAVGTISSGERMVIKPGAATVPAPDALDAAGQAQWDRVIDGWMDRPDIVPQFATQHFPPTGYSVSSRFLAYWNRYGQILPLGYPISDPFTGPGVSNPQQQYLMQCFERGLFELHPEYVLDTARYRVEEALLGVARYEARYGSAGAPNQTANQAPGDSRYFPETGHWVGGRFWRYWQENNGLTVLGYPISDEFTEVSGSDPGQTYRVQYFQRDLLEYHPEYAGSEFEVLAALVGRYYCQGETVGTPTATATVAPAPAAPESATPSPTETETAVPNTPAPRPTRPPGSASPTDTPAATATRTLAPTQTPGGPTATPVPTDTPTDTPTSTLTSTPTDTPTNTPTLTPSATATVCAASWTIVSSPNPGSSISTLQAVYARAANDVWAVGFQTSGGNKQTLIEHWNGTAWSVSTSPTVAFSDNVLYGVYALSASDAWAVGESCSSCGVLASTLILHWDGGAWTIVASPSPGDDNTLNGIGGAGSSDIWAVGYYDFGGNMQTLTLHWNGTAWTQVSSPNGPGTGSVLYGVAALSANDAWAVGNYTGFTQQTLTLHWDGSTWTQITSPSTAAADNRLTGVAMVSSSDVWAIGYYDDGTDSYSTSLHWDGGQWTIIQPSTDPAHRMHAIAARAANDVWAVGEEDTITAVYHWDGSSWTRVSSPNAGGANELLGVSIAGWNDVWAVGSSTTGTTKTLVEHYACP